MKKNLKQRISAGALALLTVFSISSSAFADEVQNEELAPTPYSQYNSTLTMEGGSTHQGPQRSYTAGNHSLAMTMVETFEDMPGQFKATLKKHALGGTSTVSSKLFSRERGGYQQEYMAYSQSSGTYSYYFSTKTVDVNYPQWFKANITMRS